MAIAIADRIGFRAPARERGHAGHYELTTVCTHGRSHELRVPLGRVARAAACPACEAFALAMVTVPQGARLRRLIEEQRRRVRPASPDHPDPLGTAAALCLGVRPVQPRPLSGGRGSLLVVCGCGAAAVLNAPAGYAVGGLPCRGCGRPLPRARWDLPSMARMA